MKKQTLEITITGMCGSGKSRLLFIIKNFLKNKGFDVEYGGDFDYPTEFEFDKCMVEHNDEVIDFLIKNRTIVINEKQIKL